MSEPILTRIAAGDGSAVSECVERYGNLVWSIARRLTANRGDAEDAVQEIFIELWSKAAQFDPERASEASFIAMVARRRTIDRLRKAGRDLATVEIDAAPEPAEDPNREPPLRLGISRGSRWPCRLFRTSRGRRLGPRPPRAKRLPGRLDHGPRKRPEAALGAMLGRMRREWVVC